MKNFLEYLGSTQKTYEFKVKLANVDVSEHMDCIKTALAGYVVENISAPKHLPIMENSIDFPSLKNADVHVIEVALQYPVNAPQLRVIIAEAISASLSQVFVVPAGAPEELWREGEGELREFIKGENVLTQPLPEATAEQKAASRAYSEAGSILKELNKSAKFEIAGKEAAQGKTTNELPQNTTSPVKGQ